MTEFENVWECLLVFVCVSSFLLMSISVWMVSGGGVVGIWMVSIVVCCARMCLVGYLIAYPLQGGEFTLF